MSGCHYPIAPAAGSRPYRPEPPGVRPRQRVLDVGIGRIDVKGGGKLGQVVTVFVLNDQDGGEECPTIRPNDGKSPKGTGAYGQGPVGRGRLARTVGVVNRWASERRMASVRIP